MSASGINRFVGHVYNKVSAHGFGLSMIPVPSLVLAGVPCGAYFCERDKQLAVATAKPRVQWAKRLLHEFCHFEQWRVQCDPWVVACDDAGMGLSLIGLWLTGKVEFNANQLEGYFSVNAAVELDCEKRAAAKLGYWDLGIEREEYVVSANSYIFSWWVASRHRMWLKPQALDEHHELLKLVCPKRFLPVRSYRDLEQYPHLYELLTEKCMAPVH
ncbi:MAG: hypothetical protein ACYC63_04730 [Armatimonadota bacterium]